MRKLKLSKANISEKIILITGANRGIGYAVANELAKVNSSLILACRNKSEGLKAKEKIEITSGNKKICVLPLDLASFSSIRRFCKEFSKYFQRLDVLINNAGIFTMDEEKTEDNLEMTMGINYFGTFLLTNLLIPFLEKSKEGRIINVVSDAFKKGKLDVNNIEKRQTTGMKAYTASKYALVQFTTLLAEKVGGTNISVNAVHPGHVNSGIWNFNKWYAPIFRLFSKAFMSNSTEGAIPILHLVLSEEGENINGKYFKKEREEEIEKMDNEDQIKLWRKSKEIVGLN